MAEPLVSDDLWEAIAPLLPRHKAKPGKRGRPPVDDRACLTGIVLVLRSGIPWEMLPQEMGCGSGVTCWRRLRYWQRRGVWKKLLHGLLDRLGRAGLIDWEKACVDSQSIRAVFGGPHRQKPHGSGQKRQQPAPARRWPWHAAGPAPHRSEPPGRARGAAVARRDPPDPRATR